MTATSDGGIHAKLKNLGREIWKNRAIYFIALPGLLWYIIFAYGPMGGLILAFKTYKANLGIWGSPLVGLDNFQNVLRDPAFMRAVIRTLWINAGRVIFEFPMPVVLALILNELRLRRYKRFLQVIFTFPHFLSWVIVSSILINFLSYDGFVNGIITMFSPDGVNFLGNTKIFQAMLYITSIWKGAGWSAIIYMAAISGIDMDQYEAAEIDGASRIQRLTRITIPNILPTITVMFILQMGSLMSSGFDQIFNLSNAAVKDVAEILDIYVYDVTFKAPPDFGFSMAISMFRSVINMILILIADRGAKLLGGEGLVS